MGLCIQFFGPLKDADKTQQIQAVFQRGRCFTGKNLDAVVDEAKDAVRETRA